MGFSRSRTVFLAAFSLVAFIAASSQAASPPAQAWPHTDVAPDPAIVFGRLPNGMRYLIRHNASPVGGVSLRLRIATGSTEEDDANEGIAHFMEHMAFRGSAHFADGDAFKTLEGLGASRGADSNAFTASHSTVFMFDVAKNDPAALDTGLKLLRDIASNATIAPKAVDSERYAVLAEARQDDIAAYHAYTADMAAALGPRVADALMPIGKKDIVAHATAAQIRRFYEAHYRPEKATLIVIGDIDPKLAQAKLVARFADWRARVKAAAPPVLRVQTTAGPHFTVFAETGATPAISLTWVAPYDNPPDTQAQEFHDLARQTALSILNLRLQKLAHEDNPPFLSASAGDHKLRGIGNLTEIEAGYAPGKMADALRAMHETCDDMLKNGVRADELAQTLASTRVYFQNEATARDTTTNARLAHDYLDIIDEDGVISAPDENLALYDDAAKRMTPADVSAGLRTLFAGSGPSVFAVDDKPIAGGGEILAASWRDPAAPAAATNVANSGGASWPYTDFGPRGQIASRDHVDDLDVTRVTFANGVRATIKPTKYRAGQVLITVSFGNGRLGLPKDRKTASWALGVFASGGLGKLDVDSIHRLLASKAWGAGFSVSDDSFNLAGSTRPEDYETELQLLTAYLNDPGWRPQAFERAQTSMVAALKEADAMPGGVYALQAPAIAHGGDARWTTPSIDEVKGARLEDARALLGPALERGPVEVTVVGDIAVDDALKGLAQTFGALDRRFTAPAEIAGDERLPPPSGAPLALRHRGGKDQAIAFIAWPTQGLLPDAREARTLKVLELVMSQRLFDVLRTQEGMTYTPSLDSDNSLATPAYGYLSVATEIPPGKVPEFYAAIDRSIAGLKEKEISGDELARARDPHVEDIIHAQETNQYWLEVLRHSQADPRWFDLVRSTVPDLKAVTATDVLNAARTYLSDDRSWKLVVLPKDEGATAGGAP